MAIQTTGFLEINNIFYKNPKINITPILGYRGQLAYNATLEVNELEILNFSVPSNKNNLINDGVSNPYDILIHTGEQEIINYLCTIGENSLLDYDII